MTAREVVARLMAEGWYVTRQAGSHQQFSHPNKPGERVTVPVHRGDLKRGTLHSIFKQAGWK